MPDNAPEIKRAAILGDRQDAADQRPRISVIIPVHNARDQLSLSLPAVRRSDCADYELIVVDDRSTDGSAEFAQSYADSVLRLEVRAGPAAARNRGASESRGGILLFVDADVVVAPDTLSLVLKALDENPGWGAVFGSYDAQPYDPGFFSQFKNLFHHYIHQTAAAEAATFWSGCGAVRRELFFEAGGFPERYSAPAIEDVELGYRLREHGVVIRLLKNLQVTHLKRWSLANLVAADIRRRAVPWVRLATNKGLPRDLNFKFEDRLSGAAVLLLAFFLLAAWRRPWCLAVVLFLVPVLLWINRKLYRFFLVRKGLWFALGAVLFHWFYLGYSSAAFALLFVVFSMGRFFRMVLGSRREEGDGRTRPRTPPPMK